MRMSSFVKDSAAAAAESFIYREAEIQLNSIESGIRDKAIWTV